MAADEPTTVPPDSPPVRPGPPPLRIHHLLLWTVVAALLLTQLHGQRTSGIRWGNSEADWVLIAVTDVIFAAEITLGALLFYWYAKGHAAFSQPGQWLPVLSLYLVSSYWLVRLLDSICPPSSFTPKGILLWNLSDLPPVTCAIVKVIILWVFPAIIYFVAARRAANTRPWRYFYVLSAVGGAWEAFTNLWSTGSYLVGKQPAPLLGFLTAYFSTNALRWAFVVCPMLVGPSMLTWAIVDDRLRGRPRDWTHWLGALLALAAGLISLGRMLTIPH